MNWIEIEGPGALAIMPRPFGGEWLKSEIEALRSVGVDVVVSALQKDEEAFLELTEEAETCNRLGIEFVRFPIRDRSVPPLNGVSRQFVEHLAERILKGAHVAIHCRAGIGRSGLLCAATLTALGYEVSDAFNRVAAARGLRVPDTRAQMEWVFAFADPQQLVLEDLLS